MGCHAPAIYYTPNHVKQAIETPIRARSGDAMTIQLMGADDSPEGMKPIPKSLIFLGTGTSGIVLNDMVNRCRRRSLYRVPHQSPETMQSLSIDAKTVRSEELSVPAF